MNKKFCLLLVLCLLLFFLIEGVSSTLLAVYGIWCARGSPEAHYSRYDRDLGWVSIADYYNKDFYGPGVYLKVNRQGFRANRDFAVTVPSNKVRIICSGDSFTFGYSVDNDHTWCQLLEIIDPRLQTINMAESGYGIDQMYLRYRRDGSQFEHDVHILAFITDDFRRMELKQFAGFDKPILQIRDGALVPGNVPVPKISSVSRWWSVNGHCLLYLGSLRLLERIYLAVFRPRDSLSNGLSNQQERIATRVIEDLQRSNQTMGSTLVLVYLPTKEDYVGNRLTEAWRKFLRRETAKQGVVFFDLIGDFQMLPAKDLDKMFVCPESSQYFSAGHLTEEGNQYVASLLYRKLLSTPDITAKFSAHAPAAAKVVRKPAQLSRLHQYPAAE